MDVNINLNITFSPSSEVPPWAVQLLTTVGLIPEIKDIVMPLSAAVQTMVDQVTETKTIEAASAAALALLVTQSKALSDQIAVAAAAGPQMSAEDTAAIMKSAVDLHDSATALQSAVPAGVTPAAAPAAPVDSTAPPVGGA